jgi:hypothetical protein
MKFVVYLLTPLAPSSDDIGDDFLAKTIRAMADGTLDSQVGARICNGLGIMRACLETQKLEQLEARMDDIADRVARDKTNAARERISQP